MLATVGGERVKDICPKAGLRAEKQCVRAFIDRVRWGLHAETAQSSLTVIFNWSSVV